MRQRQSDDPEVQDTKSFDWSGPDSKGPSTVVDDGPANIAEIRDEHAVDQIDGDVFEPVHLAGIPGRFARRRLRGSRRRGASQGLSFEAYRRTATYLTVRGRGGHAGRTELRAISDSDLKEALSRDQGATKKNDHSDAALSPQEDGT